MLVTVTGSGRNAQGLFDLDGTLDLDKMTLDVTKMQVTEEEEAEQLRDMKLKLLTLIVNTLSFIVLKC